MSTATIEKVVPQVGDFMYSSWGYDQTNINFYKVVRTTDASIWIQEVGSEVVEVTGWAHQNVVPTNSSDYQTRNWDDESGSFYITRTYPIQRKRVRNYADSYSVSMNSYAIACFWDGQPKSQSQTH